MYIRYLRELILCCCMAVTAITVTGQQNNISFDHYGSENIKLEKGLSQNWIYASLQDRMGYLWFGTWEGLNRFDGYTFKVYSIEQGLSNHTVYALLEDRKERLWVGTERGLNLFDRKTQTFRQYLHDPANKNSLVSDRITALLEDRNGNIWIGTNGGLSRLDPATGRFVSLFENVQPSYSPRSSYITSLLEDGRGSLWIGTTYGLIQYDPATTSSTRYYHVPGDTLSLNDNNVRCMCQDPSGMLLIGTATGISFYDPEEQTFRQAHPRYGALTRLQGIWIRSLFVDRSGMIWAGTNDRGLWQYDRSAGQLWQYTHQTNDKRTLSNNTVYNILQDNPGNIWIGTSRGVNKINRYSSTFNLHQVNTTGQNSIPDNNVWSFLEDGNDNLWIATSGGVSMFDKARGKYGFLACEPGKENSLVGNDCRTMLLDKQDNIWIGTYGSGMDRIRIADLKITHFTQDRNNPNALASNYINDILEDAGGTVWIASGGGLCRFVPSNNSFVVFRNDPNNPASLSHNVTICLHEDGRGVLWVGTNNGLNRFDRGSGMFTRYINIPGDPKSLSNNTVFSILEDDAGILWLGTSGGGINRFDAVKEEFEAFTVEDGLANNIVYGMLRDDDGNLWISTNRGISKFMMKEKVFVNYDVSDNLQSNEFNLGSCYRSRSGMMYFGGVNGYNTFYPDDIQTNPEEPVIVITAFRIFNEVIPADYRNGDTIILDHKDNFFAFEFSALDYSNPMKNVYRYLLEKVDNDWILTGADKRLAEYKNVKPGTYVFMVNGTNNDGLWNDGGLSLTVIIRPPWYGTWLFRIGLGALLVILVWLFVYRRIIRVRSQQENERKRLEVEKKIFDLEQVALRLQMNPHFIFNSLNSIQSYILSHDSETAINYLGKFSQLMRLILANSQKKLIPLSEELKAVTHYLDIQKLRFGDKFVYSIMVDEGIDQEYVELPPMILQPYIENAIIHGLLHKESNGRVEVRLWLDGNRIVCSIEDDGIGREKSAEIESRLGIRKKSRGMLITQARLEFLKHHNEEEDFTVRIVDLKDEAGEGCGTRVEIHFPFENE